MKKEEPKQETLEEFIKKELDGYDEIDIRTYKTFIYLGAKWQQQQNKNLYSEYEVYRKLHNLMTSIKLDGLVINDDMDLKKWFEQNKNK